MACACGNGTKKQQTYIHKLPDGSTKVYSSEIEAKAAAQSKGGTVRPQA